MNARECMNNKEKESDLSEIEKEDLQNLLKFEYSEENPDMHLRLDNTESSIENVNFLTNSEMADLLQRTKIRLKQRLNYLRENKYKRDLFLLEFSLIHFGFYHTMEQKDRLKLKEKSYLTRIIKIYLKELEYLVMEIRGRDHDFEFSSQTEYNFSVKMNLELRNGIARLIMQETYKKIMTLGCKKKVVNLCDLFIELYFRIFGVGIPSQEFENYSLNKAIFESDIQAVKKILSYNDKSVLFYDINQPDLFGFYPMHFAIKAQNLRIVNLLLESGALVFEKSLPLNQSCYEYALESGNHDIIKTLLMTHIQSLSLEDFNRHTFAKTLFKLTPVSNFNFYVENPRRLADREGSRGGNLRPFYTHVLVKKDDRDLRIKVLDSNKKNVPKEITGEEDIRDSMELKISHLNSGFFHFTLKERGSLRAYKVEDFNPIDKIKQRMTQLLKKGTKVKGLFSYPKYKKNSISIKKKKNFLGFNRSQSRVMTRESDSFHIVKKTNESKGLEELKNRTREMLNNEVCFEDYLWNMNKHSIFPVETLNLGITKATDANEHVLAHFLIFLNGDQSLLKIIGEEEMSNYKSMMSNNKKFRLVVEIARGKINGNSKKKVGNLELIYHPPLTNTMIYYYLWLLVSYDFCNFEIFENFRILKSKVEKMIPGIVRARDNDGLKVKLRFYYFCNLKSEQEIIEIKRRNPENSEFIDLLTRPLVSGESPSKLSAKGSHRLLSSRNYNPNLSLVQEEDSQESSSKNGLMNKPFLTLPGENIHRRQTNKTTMMSSNFNQFPSEFLKSYSTLFVSQQSSFKPSRQMTIDRDIELSELDFEEFYSPTTKEFDVFTKGNMISYNSSRIKTMNELKQKKKKIGGCQSNKDIPRSNFSLRKKEFDTEVKDYLSPQKKRSGVANFSLEKKSDFSKEKSKTFNFKLKNLQSTKIKFVKDPMMLDEVPSEKTDLLDPGSKQIRVARKPLPSMRARNKIKGGSRIA